MLWDCPTVQRRAWFEIESASENPAANKAYTIQPTFSPLGRGNFNSARVRVWYKPPQGPSRLEGSQSFSGSVLNIVLLRSWVLAQFCCDQSAVAVRLSAGQSRAQLAFLSRLGSTSRTTDSEDLFWAEVSFHGGEIVPRKPCTRMVSLDQL
jgi:hypothetical protein